MIIQKTTNKHIKLLIHNVPKELKRILTDFITAFNKKNITIGGVTIVGHNMVSFEFPQNRMMITQNGFITVMSFEHQEGFTILTKKEDIIDYLISVMPVRDIEKEIGTVIGKNVGDLKTHIIVPEKNIRAILSCYKLLKEPLAGCEFNHHSEKNSEDITYSLLINNGDQIVKITAGEDKIFIYFYKHIFNQKEFKIIRNEEHNAVVDKPEEINIENIIEHLNT